MENIRKEIYSLGKSELREASDMVSYFIDSSIEGFEGIGELMQLVHPKSPPEDIITKMGGAMIVIASKLKQERKKQTVIFELLQEKI